MMTTTSTNRHAWMMLGASCVLVAIIAALVVLDQRSPATASPSIGDLQAIEDVQASSSELADSPGTTDQSTTGASAVALSKASSAMSTDCSISSTLDVGSTGPDVQCLEMALATDGYFSEVPDQYFDATTAAAVTKLQEAKGLHVDGIAGAQTSGALGLWVVPEPDPSTCEPSGRSAIVDRVFQRMWLCEDGEIVREMKMTSSSAQPDPGSYRVTERQMNATSMLSGKFSRMTHFVVFTTGKFSGARVGFHSVPTYRDGSLAQPLDSVGELRLIGESSGCIRTVPDDATAIWDFLAIDDSVVVIS